MSTIVAYCQVKCVLYHFSYKLHEVLQMLEDKNKDNDVLGAEISILPPINTGDDTDVDSGDEELLSTGHPDNLNHNQLLADAPIKIQKPRGDV